MRNIDGNELFDIYYDEDEEKVNAERNLKEEEEKQDSTFVFIDKNNDEILNFSDQSTVQQQLWNMSYNLLSTISNTYNYAQHTLNDKQLPKQVLEQASTAYNYTYQTVSTAYNRTQQTINNMRSPLPKTREKLLEYIEYSTKYHNNLSRWHYTSTELITYAHECNNNAELINKVLGNKQITKREILTIAIKNEDWDAVKLLVRKHNTLVSQECIAPYISLTLLDDYKKINHLCHYWSKKLVIPMILDCTLSLVASNYAYLSRAVKLSRQYEEHVKDYNIKRLVTTSLQKNAYYAQMVDHVIKYKLYDAGLSLATTHELTFSRHHIITYKDLYKLLQEKDIFNKIEPNKLQEITQYILLGAMIYNDDSFNHVIFDDICDESKIDWHNVYEQYKLHTREYTINVNDIVKIIKYFPQEDVNDFFNNIHPHKIHEYITRLPDAYKKQFAPYAFTKILKSLATHRDVSLSIFNDVLRNMNKEDLRQICNEEIFKNSINECKDEYFEKLLCILLRTEQNSWRSVILPNTLASDLVKMEICEKYKLTGLIPEVVCTLKHPSTILKVNLNQFSSSITKREATNTYIKALQGISEWAHNTKANINDQVQELKQAITNHTDNEYSEADRIILDQFVCKISDIDKIFEDNT